MSGYTLNDKMYKLICDHYMEFIDCLASKNYHYKFQYEVLYRYAYIVHNCGKSQDFILLILNKIRNTLTLSESSIQPLCNVLIYIENVNKLNLFSMFKFMLNTI